MADPLYELLVTHFDASSSPPRPVPNIQDSVTTKYLNRLSTLPLTSLVTTEPQSLNQASQSVLLSLQSLLARSSAAIIASADHLSHLSQTIPLLAIEAKSLQDGIPNLDEQAVAFSSKYSRSAENEVLDRRKKVLMMARNVDRLSDILDLPTLLSSAISSATAQSASSTANYAWALDIHSHIKRLYLLHQDSALISSIYAQTEAAMRDMTTNLIASLRIPNIKLAAAMRTIGWLRRVAPELDIGSSAPIRQPYHTGSNPTRATNREGNALGALFLVCRLGTLDSMLNALSPLRDLADQESHVRLRNAARIENPHTEKKTSPSPSSSSSSSAWSGGHQTERYLKRYIEIFREQSFAIISMYKSIFPSSPDHEDHNLGSKFRLLGLKSVAVLPGGVEEGLLSSSSSSSSQEPCPDLLSPLPSALSTFPLHLVDLLMTTLWQYLPNVRDRSSRESLLTQVLYCAGSLGRLGVDFSFMLAVLAQQREDERRSRSDDEEEEEEEERDDEGEEGEWVEVMRKHRVLAGKLELLAKGGGDNRAGAASSTIS